MPQRSRSGTEPGLPGWLLLAGVLLLAANQRALISAVGPVLPEIAAETGLSSMAQGVLTAAPVAAFAIVSPLVHGLGRRWGVDRVLLVSLVLVAAGTVLRSAPMGELSVWGLMAGTLVIGAAVAVNNVLLPVVVDRDHQGRVATVTGHYVAVQSIAAAISAALAVPIAIATGSWRLALAVWALMLLPAALCWAPRLGRDLPIDAESPVTPRASVWRSGLAWQVAGYFWAQSTAFYIVLNWLPTLEQEMGISPATAGAHLSLLLLVCIAGSVAVPRVLTIAGDQRISSAVVGLGLIVGAAGLLLYPGWAVVWISLLGFVLGAALVVALALIGLRGGNADTVSALSSMVQAAAYAGVVAALLLAGWVRDLAGPGPELLQMVIAMGLLQALLGLAAGRTAQIHPRVDHG